MASGPAGAGQDVEGQRKFLVASVEENHVVASLRGDRGEHRVSKLAVGIEQPHAMPGGDIRREELVQEGGFAHAGFPDRVKMAAAIVGQDAARLRLGTKGRKSQHGQARVNVRRGQLHRWLRFPALHGRHRRRLHAGRRRVPEGGQFLGRKHERWTVEFSGKSAADRMKVE